MEAKTLGGAADKGDTSDTVSPLFLGMFALIFNALRLRGQGDAWPGEFAGWLMAGGRMAGPSTSEAWGL
ncbi:MAG TPA: hypothetical protein VLA45_06250, partial [Paracoccaceae bacterium]|nr:hypothetical protein [Paracoccaceae bacterium]